MWNGVLLLTTWMVSQSLNYHVTKRLAAQVNEAEEEDPLRRRTMQSLIGLLGITATTAKTTPDDPLFTSTSQQPSLFTRTINLPFSCTYTLQPPEHATITKNMQHHVQWSCRDWELDVIVQPLPHNISSWNDLVQQRLLQVQQDENCVATCREEPWRLSSHALELVYTTRHRPWHPEHHQEWKTRMHWNDRALLLVHCHGRVLPDVQQSVLQSIVFQ